MLFDVVVDVLQKMMEVVNTLVNNRLTRKVQKAVIIDQYADDTVLIANTEVSSMVTLKLILRVFTAISSLSINFEKKLLDSN